MGAEEHGIDSRTLGQLTVIRLDYEQSLKFVDGVVRISSTIRQTTMTAAVALIGLSIQNESPPLALAAVVLGILMGLYDGYHGWLYSTCAAASFRWRLFFELRSLRERDHTMKWC